MNPNTRKWKLFFKGADEVFHASAPGRLDVMGGIADYSGSYVLQMPIAERTHVYISLRNDGVLRACSQTASEAGIKSDAEIELQDLLPKSNKMDLTNIRSQLTKEAGTSWAAYVFGCVVMLYHDYGVQCNGANIWIDSKVPIGKGVSSSAALEVATLNALCAALKIKLPGNELPVLAQKVENIIVGAPCGLMDQLATYFGKERKLLPILCRPDLVKQPIEIPRGIHFVGIDSGVRHAVSGASYSDVRTAAFMGYSIIAASQNITATQLRKFKKNGDRNSIPYQGYLTGISPSEFERNYVGSLPDKISGENFILKFKISIDQHTSPQSSKSYNVKACSKHPVFEHHRVQQFGLLLDLLNQHGARSTKESTLLQLGELMYQSHESYYQCGLGCEATDRLVQQSVKFGSEHGIYGAKITGGGGGGTVCFLCYGSKGLKTVKQIAENHAAAFQTDKTLFTKSSDGAKWNTAQKIRL